MLSGFDELQKFLDKSAAAFYRGMRDIYWSRYGEGESNNAIRDMASLISRTLILANLNGRKRVLMEADRAAEINKFSQEKSPISPLPFVEAIEDLTSRDPRLAFGYKAVAKLYSEEHVFALAKSINKNLSERIQKAISDTMKSGEGLPKFSELWREITPWTQNYADVVYRTNTSSAFTAGRIEQAKDPDVMEAVPALEYISMHLPNTRPNHEAASGLIASSDDPIWNTFSPPLGFQCRCGVNMISRYELERRGLFKDGKVIRFLPPNFAAAHPDYGFKPGGWN